MHADDFDFALPPELIAQEPLQRATPRGFFTSTGTRRRTPHKLEPNIALETLY